MNAITTDLYRTNQAKAQAGAETLKVVAKIAFGDGGINPDGSVKTPLSSETALYHKLQSFPVESITYPTATTVRYTARLPLTGTDSLNGFNISELGLEDAAGNLLAKKCFTAQPKTSENEFVVEWDEVF